jgi:hypothetical protein
MACFGSFDHGMTCLDENGWKAMTEELAPSVQAGDQKDLGTITIEAN